MHRHHPYGGNGYEERRRSASPSARFPRGERGGSRGFGRGGGAPRGRGRGGLSYGGFDAPPPPAYDSYNSSNSYDGPSSGYGGQSSSNYSSAPPPPVPAYPREPAAPNYDSYGSNYRPNSYDDYEDSSNRAPRRQRDDKVHDRIIEDRINRERPCRTLFVRNIKYESDSQALRRQFEEHGMIRTFFDLISSRGMLFVTFYDLRAAQAARERLQGMEVTARPIDVHYSLPRPDETTGRVDRDKHQGTLLVTLRNSNMAIEDNELRRKFQQFGDVKSIKSVPGRHDQRHVEMYDTRATEQIYDTLRHQGLQDGVMDLEWAWDVLDDPVTDAVARSISFREEAYASSSRGGSAPPPRGRGSYRGGARGGGRGGSGSGGGYDDYDRRDSRDNDRDSERDKYWKGNSRDHEDDRYNRGGFSGRGGGGYRGGGPSADDGRRGSDSRGYPRNDNYGSSAAPPPPTPATPDDRLEQARKVQQLLAALKNPGDASVSQAQPPPPPPAVAAPPAAPRAFLPGPNTPYGTNPPPPGAAYSGGPPPLAPAAAWGGGIPPPLPPPSAYPPPAAALATGPPSAAASAGASLAGLPPAVLALLAQTAQSHSQSAAAPSSSGHAPAVQNPQAMQHLLALLAAQSQQKPT